MRIMFGKATGRLQKFKRESLARIFCVFKVLGVEGNFLWEFNI